MSKCAELFRLNMEDLSKSSVYIKKPEIIDLMKSDGFRYTKALHLNYFKEPVRTAYPLDLNKYYEQYIFRYDTYDDRQLNQIEEYIMTRNPGLTAGSADQIKVFTRRNVLNRIMMAPYEFRGATVLATRHNGAIYLASGPVKSWPHSQSDTHHFKFEQYCYADSTKHEPNTEIPIDENEQLFALFRTNLTRFQLFYSVELDGVIADSDIEDLSDMAKLNEFSFITTKLLREKFQRSWQTSRPIFKWWVQAHLANVNNIYLAFKNDQGLVKSPGRLIAVQDLAKNQSWQPKVCVGFLDKFLTMVEQTMSDVNCPQTVYEFIFEDAGLIKYRIHKGRNSLSFLGRKFVEHLQKQ